MDVLSTHARQSSDLSETQRSLFALVDPSLKVDGHFQHLANQVRELEDNVEYGSTTTNVRDYNVATAAFPSSVVASALAFAPAEFFELGDPDEERKPVKIDCASADQ